MEYGYLVSPGVQIHHEVLGLGVSVAHLALVAVGVPGHALGHVPVVIMVIVMMILIMIVIIMMMIVIMIVIIVMMIVIMIILIVMIVPVVLVLGDELVALVTLWARSGL